MTNDTLKYLLLGVAGSHAHGLATPESDKDYHGVFSYPTARFWRLDKPVESVVHSEPDDYSAHELEKFLRLAVKGNPSAMEVLWLKEYVEMDEEWGARLLSVRSAVLSRRPVKDAYTGYAVSQLKEVTKRRDAFNLDWDSPEYRKVRKLVKHMFRLLEQGSGLYFEGEFRVSVADPREYDRLVRLPYGEVYDEFWDRHNAIWDGSSSVLPEEPDLATLNQFLHDYRKAH